MEGSTPAADPFATSAPEAPAPAATDDPFANAGAAPEQQPDADLEPTTAGDVAAEVAAEPAADLPVVDKEGAVVEPPAEEAPASTVPVNPHAPSAPPLPATMTAAGRAKAAEADATGEQPAAEAPAEAQEAAEAPATPPETPEAQADGDGGEQPPAQPPAAPAQDPPAPEPVPEGGKGELRLYKLLYQTGETGWTEADLSGVADDLKQYVGKDPKAPDDGVFLKARNNDHARRLAWIIMGRPEAGVTVSLIARTSWKPKRLSTAPPEPSRERLVIS